MPRPRTFDLSEALEKAMQLFWTKGYAASSLTSLTEAMDIGKSSFYAAFDSKHDVLMKTLAYYKTKVFDDLENLMSKAASPKDAVEAIFDYFLNLIAAHDCRGCFFANIMNELALHDSAVQIMLKDVVEGLQVSLTKLIKEGQTLGQFHPGHADGMASTLMATFYGMLTIAKLQLTHIDLVSIKREILYGLSVSP